MSNLLCAQDIGQLTIPSWIKRTRYDIIHPQDVFVEEATGLGDHPTFVIARTKLFFDKVDIGNDIVLINLYRVFRVVEGKQVPHLRGVVADGAGRIILGFQVGRCFQDQALGFFIE